MTKELRKDIQALTAHVVALTAVIHSWKNTSARQENTTPHKDSVSIYSIDSSTWRDL